MSAMPPKLGLKPSLFVFACEKCKATITNHEPHGRCKCGVEWAIERKP